MAINNRAVLRDHERLLEREVTSFSECGQFAGWNPELMPSVAWMRMEFVQMTGYLLAMKVVQFHFGGREIPKSCIL